MLLLIFLICGTVISYAGSNNVTLKIDDKIIPTKVAPVIINNRTLVPVRAVFEAMGGVVDWSDSKPSDISIKYQNRQVDLKINSTVAYVDGAQKTLEVPAQLVNNSTLIPVRFVSENLGFTVGFDDNTRTVLITSPKTDANPPTSMSQIESVKIETAANKSRISITSNLPISQYTNNSLANPDRFFVDIPNSRLYTNETSISSNDYTCIVNTVRFNTDDNNTTRIVMDLKKQSTPSISFSADKKVMYLDFEKLGFDPMADGRLVVMLDPGHGASTGGKRSPDGSLKEYEFNRDVASRVKAILEQNGIEAMLTVSDDTDTSLKDRCSIANGSDADIFVSVHANAFGDGWTSAKGWEIYVYKKGGIAEELAKAIQKQTTASVDISNRGLKEADFYVIKYTNIPAVLIEHGFYTNKDEVEQLKSSSFRQQLAEADAAGIINFFKAYQK